MRRFSLAMICFAAVGMITMVSCNKPVVINNALTLPRTVTINATTVDGGGSKTTLDGLDVKWSANDVIYVNGTDTGNQLKLASAPGSTLGIFSSGSFTATTPYLVGYPEPKAISQSEITFTIPSNQGTNDDKLTGKLPMAAYSAEGDYLAFKNMVNVLRLDLTGSASLYKIKVESTDEYLSGDFTVGTDLMPSVVNAGTTTKEITIVKSIQLDPTTPQTVYVVLPVFGNAGSTVKVNFRGSSGTDAVTMALDGSDTPNHRYMAAVNVELIPKADPKSVTTRAGCTSEYIYTIGGTVTLTEAQEVEYGFVYSESVQTPTIGAPNCHKVVGGIEDMPIGTNSFTLDITGLTTDVTYYVRAYAIGESGNVVHATNVETVIGGNTPQPLPSNWINGTTPEGKWFTVSAGTDDVVGTADDVKVRFSQGNLQYIGSAATPYWKFANHQFDCFGTITGQNSESATVDRDLFGWGTSGWNNGNYLYMPYDTDNSTYPYTIGFGYGPVGPYNLTGNYAQADWGYNDISNDGNLGANVWRTLTEEEWVYLFESRTDASNKWSLGTVGSCTRGLIILPDEWTCPEGCSFSGGKTSFTANCYSYTQWYAMEQAGAVMLPGAGQRNGTNIATVDMGAGFYWMSSCKGVNNGYRIWFYGGNFVYKYGTSRHYGNAVRLVR